MVEGLAGLAELAGLAGLAEEPLWMPTGDPFGAAWDAADGVTAAPAEGDATGLAGGEILASGAGMLGAGLAASTGLGARIRRPSTAQKIHRLSGRTLTKALAPSHQLRIPGQGCSVTSSIRRDRGRRGR